MDHEQSTPSVHHMEISKKLRPGGISPRLEMPHGGFNRFKSREKKSLFGNTSIWICLSSTVQAATIWRFPYQWN